MADEPTVDRTAEATRRGRLVAIKLRTLVREHLSVDDVGEPDAFAPGAALLCGDEAWVYLDDRPAQRLGAALAWALRAGAGGLHVIAESGSGVLARRATEFSLPVTVWHNEQRALWPAVPEPFPASVTPPAEHLGMRAMIEAGGAEPIEEFGVLAGEVRGLEVCRVVDDPYTGEVRLDVGIGEHDREAFAMLHANSPTIESLQRVVATVAEHRRLDAPPHPFNRLARERLLRWHLVAEPQQCGASELHPVEPPVARSNLKDPVPCVAAGRDAEGDVVVVCSVGVDLDLVPYAADARRAADAASPGVRVERSRLVLVTPSRDRIRVTDELAGLLRQPCEFVSLG